MRGVRIRRPLDRCVRSCATRAHSNYTSRQVSGAAIREDAMAKDAKGHGSEGRGGKFEPSATGNKKFLGQGGKADPNRPVIERHDAPFGVLGYFHAQTGAPVARSVAEDMAGQIG